MFTFADMFAGIGGIRLALEETGGRCVFSCEIDKYAKKTYDANFDSAHDFHDDINTLSPGAVPDHTLMAGGFPCNSFSIAGVSKRTCRGLEHGFKDPKYGNLFFKMMSVVKAKKPAALLFENVKNLQTHNKGETWKVIKTEIENAGYNLSYRIMDSDGFVPQRRKRIFMVGLRKEVFGERFFDFDAIKLPKKGSRVLGDILEEEVSEKYTLRDGTWNARQRHAERHKNKGNGFSYTVVAPTEVAPTLPARYYKDGADILIEQEGQNPRKLTPRECARLMGFPEDYQIPVSDTQSFKQFGNSVVVGVVRAIARELATLLHPIAETPANNG